MPRFFIPPNTPFVTGERITLPEDESRHAAEVLRLDTGAVVTLFDGRGSHCEGRIHRANRTEVVVTMGAIHRSTPPSCRLGVAVAIPKGTMMDGVVQKVTELGAAELFPLVTSRTVIRLAFDEGSKKVAKWRRIAIESCKQCGTDWLPEIHPPNRFEATLNELATQYEWILVAALTPDAASLRDLLSVFIGRLGRKPTSVLLVIGPEGDLSPEELDFARAKGAGFMTLGPLVLRVETAVTTALALAAYEMAW